MGVVRHEKRDLVFESGQQVLGRHSSFSMEVKALHDAVQYVVKLVKGS